MKKIVLVLLLILLPLSLSVFGCDKKEPQKEIFLVEEITSSSESGVKIVGLTEYGKSLQSISIPSKINGFEVKIIGESNVEVHLCNAGIGRKAVTRPIFDIEGGNFSVTGMAAFGFSEKSEYHTLIRDKESDTTILWDDVEEYIPHLRSMNHYKN